MREKQIIIRNAEAIENYLKLDIRGRRRLKHLDLQDNRRIPGVRELLELIPRGFDFLSSSALSFSASGRIMNVETFSSVLPRISLACLMPSGAPFAFRAAQR